MTLRIACVGGGPGGLFLGALVKKAMPDAEFTLFERNRADDAFGFGVVFSDQTLTRIDAADPVLHDALAEHGVHWDPIQVWLKDERISFAGNGMAAINRRILLGLLQDRATELGVDLRFSTNITDVEELSQGLRPGRRRGRGQLRLRERFSEYLHPQSETATAKFIWFGTTYMFDGLTFVHRKSEHGNFAVHGYPISSDLSTFIVETDEDTWRAAGLDEFDVTAPPGASDVKSKAYLEDSVRPRHRRAHPGDEQLPMGQLPHPPHPGPGTTTTSSGSAMPFTQRTSRSVRAPKWRWRTRSAWPRNSLRIPTTCQPR